MFETGVNTAFLSICWHADNENLRTEEASPPLIARETELDHEASAAPETTTTESAALGLALSGGLKLNPHKLRR